MAHLREPDLLEVGLEASGLCAAPVKPRGEREVLEGRESTVGTPENAQVDDALPDAMRLFGEVEAEHAPHASAWAQPRREHPQERRLARAVAPFKHKCFAC